MSLRKKFSETCLESKDGRRTISARNMPRITLLVSEVERPWENVLMDGEHFSQI